MAGLLLAFPLRVAGQDPAPAASVEAEEEAHALDTAFQTRGRAQVLLEGQTFAGFRSSQTATEDFSEFVLDRAELGTTLLTGRFGSELRLEAIRSVSPQSVMGIDGDSLLLRVKRAWAFGRQELGPGAVEGRLGLIPDVWKELLENDYDLRGLAPTLSERAGYFDTSDLGLMAGWDGWENRVRVRVQVSNGEGRSQPERNTGKNTTVAATFTPVAVDVHRGPIRVSVHGAWRQGSEGFANARSHRMATGLTFVAPCPRAGVEYVRALGWDGRPEVVSEALGMYANSYFGTRWIGGAVRHDRVNTDTAREQAGVQRTTIALYTDLLGQVDSRQVVRPPLSLGFDLVRLYAAVELDRYQDNAGALPGVADASNATRWMLLLTANGFRALR
jgi:hypothetical protein